MKITKTYFLKQAWEVAKIGDRMSVYSIDDPEKVEVGIEKKEGMNLDAVASYDIPMNYAICDRWQVVEMEPKVLTADEMMEQEYLVGRQTEQWKQGYVDGFNDARENYRLERDLELRGVIEPLDEAFKYDGHNCRLTYEQRERLSDAHRNIKPLNPEKS